MATATPDTQVRGSDKLLGGHRSGGPRQRRELAKVTDRALRGGAVALLVVISIVHLHLWFGGYRYLATIGPLFLLDVIVAALLAVVVSVSRSALIAVAAAVFAAGTLAANMLSLLLPNGLFHFKEAGVSYSGGFAIASEAGAVVLLGTWTYLHWRTGDQKPASLFSMGTPLHATAIRDREPIRLPGSNKEPEINDH